MNKKQQAHAAAIARRMLRAQARAAAAQLVAKECQAELDEILSAERFEMHSATAKSERGSFEFLGVRFIRTDKHTAAKHVNAYDVPAKDKTVYSVELTA